MKLKVRFSEAWAHAGDPNHAALDAKYQRLHDQNNAKPENSRLKVATIDNQIAEMKKGDRYSEKSVGFPRDVAFKPGAEVDLPAELAKKLAACGIVTLLQDAKAA